MRTRIRLPMLRGKVRCHSPLRAPWSLQPRAIVPGRVYRAVAPTRIRGISIPSLWWDIAAYTAAGEIMPSKTGRSGFSSTNIMAAPDGRFTVRLSPDVQPGNWIPAARSTRVTLQFSILRPFNPDNLLKSGSEILPDIALVECT